VQDWRDRLKKGQTEKRGWGKKRKEADRTRIERKGEFKKKEGKKGKSRTEK